MLNFPRLSHMPTDLESGMSSMLHVTLRFVDLSPDRHPGVLWDRHPPHIDGGGIERWVTKKLPRTAVSLV